VRVALTYPHVTLRGGVERVVVDTARHLVRAGHEVHLFAATFEDGALDPAVVTHPVDVPARPDAVAALEYRRRATIALAADWPDWDTHASFSALSPLGGVFWCPSVHRQAYETMVGRRNLQGRMLQKVNPYHVVRLRLERQLLSPGGYAKVIALTDAIKDEILRFYDVPPEDIVVQPQGYDAERFNLDRRAQLRGPVRAELGLAEGDQAVVFVANELERKGFDTLVEAMAQVRDAPFRLLVVGRVEPGRYQPLIDRHGLGSRITFTGSTDDPAPYLAAADAFALPTRYEPWGLVIVEALASGLPVVTTRLAGAGRAVEDGRTGRLLTSPDDPAELATALTWALGDGPVAAEVLEASVDWLRWGNVIGRYAEILAEPRGR
jgi:UDP-glucose:(heptosyl)LPS alpha-1,3-glucosyltransferase